jgi:hypothetical protein
MARERLTRRLGNEWVLLCWTLDRRLDHAFPGGETTNGVEEWDPFLVGHRVINLVYEWARSESGWM